MLCIGASHAQENAPCRQIKEACTQAGFKPGGVKEGIGLVVDCIRPVMQGATQRAKAIKPLPTVDAAVVTACKAANPDFGEQRKSGPAAPPQRSDGQAPQ
jgi:hypothetical protein